MCCDSCAEASHVQMHVTAAASAAAHLIVNFTYAAPSHRQRCVLPLQTTWRSPYAAGCAVAAAKLWLLAMARCRCGPSCCPVSRVTALIGFISCTVCVRILPHATRIDTMLHHLSRGITACCSKLPGYQVVGNNPLLLYNQSNRHKMPVSGSKGGDLQPWLRALRCCFRT
jgi:hypothetical protein